MRFYDGNRCDSEIFETSDKWDKAWESAWHIKEIIKKECISIAQVEALLDRVLELLRMEPIAFTRIGTEDQEPS